MSKKRLVRSPNSLRSVKDGLSTGVETLRRQGLALDYPGLCQAYGVPVGTTGVSNFRTQIMAAELMVQAGANVIFADDPGWDTHGDTDGSNVLDLNDPEIFRHPLVYMSEPGFWDMTDDDAGNLRRYLLKGGFIIFDDFETTQWDNMAAQMRRVVPEYHWIEIDITHPIFHTFFDLKKIDYPHPMYPGMLPDYKALFEDNDPQKRLMAIANYNNDISEYWEFAPTGFMPIIDTNEAYKLGVNYVMHALTH